MVDFDTDIDQEYTDIDQKYNDFRAILLQINEKKEPSLFSGINSILQKFFLLCVSSYFESELSKTILGYVGDITQDNLLLSELIRKKVITRHYHTWFDWDARNANKFFNMFGDEFAEFMKARVSYEEKLDRAIKDFIEIGRDRNLIVHNDFGSYLFEKTIDETYGKYCSARYFVNQLPFCFCQFIATKGAVAKVSPSQRSRSSC